MATILATPYPMLAISRNRIINLKIVDGELIQKHLDKRFMINIGISYYERMRDNAKGYSDDELVDRLTIHSYNDRIIEKKNNRHIRDSILFDFVESSLKGIKDYIGALQIVYEQEPMQVYLSNYMIPVIANWSGQLFIHKALA